MSFNRGTREHFEDYSDDLEENDHEIMQQKDHDDIIKKLEIVLKEKNETITLLRNDIKKTDDLPGIQHINRHHEKVEIPNELTEEEEKKDDKFIQAVKGEFDRMDEELLELKNKCKEMKDKIKDMEDEKKITEEDKGKMAAKINDLHKDFKKNTEKLQVLEQEKDDQDDIIRELNEKIDASNRERVHFARMIHQERQQNEQIKKIMKTKDERNSRLSEEVKNKTAELDRNKRQRNEQLREIKEMMETKNVTISQLWEDVKNKEDELKTAYTLFYITILAIMLYFIYIVSSRFDLRVYI
ncbi:spindle pole body component 110-like [Anneissia japonica]|uniref:spindle pole body component 110-like n=1 Tax=Anneissia japonica TaxID=1529436 RepID=UPI001425999E|nr:spindle pole body component 110-like [Anneissia japonica]